MKRVLSLLFIIVPFCAFAIEGDDDNILRDYYVELYKSQEYIPDFNRVFSSSSDRKDYRKLREYLNTKEKICRILRMTGDEYYYGLSYTKLYTTDYIQGLQDEVLSHKKDDILSLRINSVRPSLNFNGNFTIAHIDTAILPIIRLRYREAEKRDSTNQITICRYSIISKQSGRIYFRQSKLYINPFHQRHAIRTSGCG